MRIRAIAASLGLVALVLAGCGDGDGSRPDITLPSTTTTGAGPAGTTSSTTGLTTTTTRPSITTTTAAEVTTTTEVETTTTAPPETTTTAPTTTSTAAVTDSEEAVPPAEADGDDDQSWWWLLLVLAGAGLLGLLLWRRSQSGPPWTEQASLLADEIDAAGRSVLIGPELTPELWTTALAKSNEVRAGAETLLDHAPSTAARQAVSEAVEALRQAEVQASSARSGLAGAGDRDAAAAELSAAVERLRVAAAPPAPQP